MFRGDRRRGPRRPAGASVVSAKGVDPAMQAFRHNISSRALLPAIVAMLLAAVLALGACADSTTAGGGTTTAAATTTGPTTGTARVTVFFPASGGEALVRTPVAASADDLGAAMDALAAGPPGAGLDPGLPAGTRVLAASADGGVATVDLSREFSAGYPSGGSAAEFRALGPLVYTATAVPGVTRVRITVEGATPDVMTQFDLSQPLARRDLPSPAEIR